jgi:teichuronic acid biosynthesis glycosyltransferase TuaC
MKVLFISSSRKGKGISPFIYEQGESLRNFGVNVDYFLIKGSGVSSYLKSIHGIRKIARSGNYQIIHAHFGFSGIIARLSLPKKKLVVSFLGDDLEGSIKKNGKYSLTGKCYVILNRLFARYFFDFNIVKSQRLSLKLPGILNKEIIPNGIDLHKYFPIEKEAACGKIGLDPSEIYFLFPSRPDRPVKNFKLFRNALGLLDKQVSVLILENISPEDVVYYYNAASVTVLTSFHEGSPNVIKEAMACNCPIVSTDVGDISWIFENTEGCFLSSAKAEDFAEKIKSALDFAYNKRRTNGRKRIGELELDSASIANRIINIYNTLAD